MSASATVVIPNWNGLAHLDECLTSLRRQSCAPSRVIVVDNASTDDSAALVRDRFSEVEWVQMPTNGGFASAVNEGIRRADTPYVALLNNDTATEPEWLAELITSLELHQDYDIAASRMVLYHDRRRMNAAGDVYSLPRAVGKNRGILQPVDRFNSPCRVLGACAGAALYRRSLFDDIGLFDEDFFLMSEDTDINIRALIAGRKCMYVPTAIVYHKLRASISAHSSKRMTLLAARNEAIVVGKDLPAVGVAIVAAAYGWRVLRATVLLHPRAWHLIPSLVRMLPMRLAAERDGLRLGFSKRRDVWSRRRASPMIILRWLIKGTGRI